MRDDFILQHRKAAAESLRDEEKKAYKSIIDMLFRMRLRGSEKVRELDEYDGESLFGDRTLYPGCIYAFLYKADSPSVFNDGKVKFEFYDNMPIVLVTKVMDGKVRGINLNLCNRALRTFVINCLHNLDPDFYSGGDGRMAAKGVAPVSNSVAKVFLNIETERQFYDYIKNKCNINHTDILYRTYRVSRIRDIRMIEVWQHKYIPFLSYTGELKQEVLKMIWRVCGIDKLTV